MPNALRVADVFRTTGLPQFTYVERDSGKFERALARALQQGGQLCLLTGPSKTGKTTLYKEVLRKLEHEIIDIRCDVSLTAEDIWKAALSKVCHEKTVELIKERKISLEGAAGVESGGVLAYLGLKAKGTIKAGRDSAHRERVEKTIAKASPVDLIPVLMKLPVVLVVEDFHYLSDETKNILFQQWKAFIDAGVSVIVVGTSHHAIDIGLANPELRGRIARIDVSGWSRNDLAEIVRKGFDCLGVQRPAWLGSTIAEESVGLPIITQQVCSQLFFDRGIDVVTDENKTIEITRESVERALFNVANERYADYKAAFDFIVEGPKKKRRIYSTYEFLLVSLALDPIKFEFSRREISERLAKVPNLERVPPPGSVNSSLGAIGAYQRRRHIELLEWSKRDNTLYILEPTFLFFLRWRKLRNLDKDDLYSVLWGNSQFKIFFGTSTAGKSRVWYELLDKMLERDKKAKET